MYKGDLRHKTAHGQVDGVFFDVHGVNHMRMRANFTVYMVSVLRIVSFFNSVYIVVHGHYFV